MDNRRFAELVGVCWHEPFADDHNHCRKCAKWIPADPAYRNPDYAADPRLVLQTLDERGLLEAFIIWLTNRLHDETGNSCIALAKLFKDKTGQLRDRTIEWMESIH